MPQLPHEIKIKAPRGFEMGARRGASPCSRCRAGYESCGSYAPHSYLRTPPAYETMDRLRATRMPGSAGWTPQAPRHTIEEQ